MRREQQRRQWRPGRMRVATSNQAHLRLPSRMLTNYTWNPYIQRKPAYLDAGISVSAQSSTSVRDSTHPSSWRTRPS